MILFLFQFPPQYAAISEQHQPAEIIPSYSTLEYTITVSIHTYYISLKHTPDYKFYVHLGSPWKLS